MAHTSTHGNQSLDWLRDVAGVGATIGVSAGGTLLL